MLRPRTALRFLLYLGLTWLVLAAVYAGLPNFTRIDDGTDYPTKVLKSGGKLTRVYEVDKYFSDSNAAEWPDERRDHIALTFRIDSASDSLIICDTARVALTKPTKLSPVQEQQEEDDDFFYLESAIAVSAAAGDTDGIVLPWFEMADSVLIYHFISRDRAYVKLRVGYGRSERRLEVWPDDDHRASQYDYPLLSLEFDGPEEDTTNTILEASVPLLSVSPSPSYRIRLGALLILAPLTIAAMGIYMAIIGIIYTVMSLFIRLFWVIAFSLLVSWLYKGRPSADDFVQQVINDVSRILRRVRDWIRRDGDEAHHLPLRNERPMAESEKGNAA